MSEIENTLSAYLGPEFQRHLMWQLLVEPEFAEKIIPNLAVEYFDDPNLKRLFIIILEFLKEFEKVPNLQNETIQQAISKYRTPNNVIEEESLKSVIKSIQNWNEMILNKKLSYNGDIIQKTANEFIKQQEYRKLGEFILEKTKNGEIRNKYTLTDIESRFQKITHIGETEDNGIEVFDNIDNVLRKEFRQTIPTGVGTIDSLTGGGLGKGEIGIILTPSGIGKSTLLTKIANTAYVNGKNVAQIIFEDTKEQIQRKHFTIWSGVALSETDDRNEEVREKIYNKIKEIGSEGKLIIKRFSQDGTTMPDIRKWMINYEKKFGFKFDLLVLDYLDCLESHKKTQDKNEAELAIVKSFEALAGDFSIPCWSAIQSNRTGGQGTEFVEVYQTGGSIKRVQKAHFFMSVNKTDEQKEAHLANIKIIKARFAQDGQMFKDCVFNNDTMQIIIDDPRYPHSKTAKNLPKCSTEDIDKFNNIIEDKMRKDFLNKASDIVLHDKIVEKSEHFIDLEIENNNNVEIIKENVKFDDIDQKIELPKEELNNDIDVESMLKDPDEIEENKINLLLNDKRRK